MQTNGAFINCSQRADSKLLTPTDNLVLANKGEYVHYVYNSTGKLAVGVAVGLGVGVGI